MGTTYKIKPRDALSGIASRYGTSVGALQEANSTTIPNTLMPADNSLLKGTGMTDDQNSSTALGDAKWQGEDILNGYISDYEDYRNKGFTYDINADALYQQYAEKYMQQGKMAMEDTIGQASAMTGGYGNSYATTAGNQAYQAHLQQLNDVIPELYQLAYDKHNQEGQELLTAISLMRGERDNYYTRYRDSVEGDEPQFTAKETKNTSLFRANIRTKTEFGRGNNADKQKYGTYSAYIEGMIDKWLQSGDLDEDEAATLLVYYGLA